MMDDIDRERLIDQIHERRKRNEPGIVAEWHDVEMRRRYELDWEKRNEAARVKRLIDGHGLSQTFLVAYIRANIPPDKLAKFREYLKNNKRRLRFPRTEQGLWRLFHRFEESIPKWTLKPSEPASFWEMEMMEHSRIAYLPLHRIHDRPFSEMPECSIWTGASDLPAFLVKGKGRPPGPKKVKI